MDPSSAAESRTYSTPDAAPAGAWLYFFAAAAILFGLWGRFDGLGKWPLAIDEYYTAQSVQNILRAGWPEYLCGGFYTRGILFQYLAALLQSVGFSPELATRLIAAVSSLLVLPAVYLLGRRLHSSTVGLLAVMVLALSVWEVEMARFGRMYMPFQAIFAWYLVFFVRYTVDRSERALWPMLALSVLGVFVWEGGALLAVTNLLPPFLRHSSGRISRRDWIYFAGAAALAIPLYVFATNELRMIGPEPQLPPAYALLHSTEVKSLHFRNVSGPLWATLAAHPAWIAAAMVPVLLALNSIRWIIGFRDRWLVGLALVAALGAALLHQFLLMAAILLLLLLLRMLDWRELFSRAALSFHATVLSAAILWTTYGLLTSDWYHSPQSSGLQVGALIAYEFVKFPHFLVEVAMPWARTVPVLGLVLFILIAAASIRTIVRGEEQLLPERAMLVALVSLLLAVGVSETPRHETRYVFFLYPLAILIALATLARMVQATSAGTRYATAGIALIGLAVFAVTEDFKPRHVWNIDDRDTNFRIGMSAAEGSHYHPRSDVRSAADWLRGHTHAGQDVVINSFPSVDFYYPGFNFYFMEWSDPRFKGWSCLSGRIARWPNLPLIYQVEDLESRLQERQQVYLVTDPWVLVRLQTALKQWRPRIAWTSADGGIHIVRFVRAP